MTRASFRASATLNRHSGASRSDEPGIHNHDWEHGFGACGQTNRAVPSQPVALISLFKQPRRSHGFAISRRDAPESLQPLARKTEGVGNAGCLLHPQPRVQSRKHTSVVATGPAGIARRPRTQWFTAYFVLSPAIGLVCHRRLRIKGLSARSGSQNLRRLDAGIEASGPHDFTVREPSICRQRVVNRSRENPPCDHVTRPFRDGALAPDLRCAIAHRGIPRFRVRCFASPRNDGN